MPRTFTDRRYARKMFLRHIGLLTKAAHPRLVKGLMDIGRKKAHAIGRLRKEARERGEILTWKEARGSLEAGGFWVQDPFVGTNHPEVSYEEAVRPLSGPKWLDV